MKTIKSNKGNFTMTQSISGYWRLENEQGELIHDDPACEDVYNENDAYMFFCQLINEL